LEFFGIGFEGKGGDGEKDEDDDESSPETSEGVVLRECGVEPWEKMRAGFFADELISHKKSGKENTNEDGSPGAFEGDAFAHDAKGDGGSDRQDEIDGNGLEVFVKSAWSTVDEPCSAIGEDCTEKNGETAENDLFAFGRSGPERQDKVADGKRREGVHDGEERGDHRGEEGGEEQSANSSGSELVEECDESEFCIASGKESEGDDPWQGEDENGSQFEQGGEHGAPSGLVKIACAEHTLDVDLVHAPVEGASIDRAGDDAPEWIIRIVDGTCDVHGVGDSSAECIPTTNFVKANKEHDAAADEHDDSLDGVGVSDGGKAANHGNDGDKCSESGDGGHDVPSDEAVEDEGTGVEGEGGFGHDANEEHQGGEEGAGEGVVASFEEVGDGEDFIF